MTVKWSALAIGAAIAGTDSLVGLQSGANVQGPFSAVSTYVAASVNTFTTTQTIAPSTEVSPLVLTGGTLAGTTSRPLISATQTWNNAGLTATALLVNVTDTSSNANSKLVDIQKGGATVLSVGTANATNGVVLQVNYDANTSGGVYPRGILGDSVDNFAHSYHIGARKARGTRASKAALQNADYISAFTAEPYDGGAYTLGGYLAWAINGTVSSGVTPTQFVVATTNASGAIKEYFTISPDGYLGIDTAGAGLFVAQRPFHLKSNSGIGTTMLLEQSDATTGQRVIAWYSASGNGDLGIGRMSNAYSLTSTQLALMAATGNVRITQNAVFGWAPSTTDPIGNAPDTAISRNAAGVMEINNGTGGTLRDIKLRNIFTALPTADPHVAGQLWANSGIVTVSAG